MNTIQETILAARTYIVWRKQIAISDISNKEMWETAFKKVNEYIQQNAIQYAGPGAALYFRWDNPQGYTDFAVGMPVLGVVEVSDPDLSVVFVPESNASHMVVRGDYSQLMGAHTQIMGYVAEHGINATLTIEEYTVTGMQQPEPKDWETNLYYLHS